MSRINLFNEMSSKDLVECYRSYCRIQCKRENENEVLKPIILKYQKHMGEKSGRVISYADMLNEIARRFVKIIDYPDAFVDMFRMGVVDKYLWKRYWVNINEDWLYILKERR